MKESRHSRRVGGTKLPRSRASDQTSRTPPAMVKRIAAMRNGGIVSTATAMPRYVEPHTMYRTSMPSQIPGPR